MTTPSINCAEVCVNGCIQPDDCPNRVYQAKTAAFIQKTSLDEMLAIAEEAVRRRKLDRMNQRETPQWVIPEDL